VLYVWRFGNVHPGYDRKEQKDLVTARTMTADLRVREI